MVRKLTLLPVFAALGAALVVLSASPATSADEKGGKTPTVKQIMSAGHKGADAAMAKVTLAVKGKKWDDAKKYAKTLADNGAQLGKNTAKKGDAGSWEKLTTKYAENTKALYEATDKKDEKVTKSALETLGASCKECHTAHRGK